MNFLDILLLGTVGASVIAGFMSGFTRTAFGMIAAVAGILLGFWFYDVPAGWYVGTLGSEMAANLFGFLTVFLIVIVVGAVAGRIVSTAFKIPQHQDPSPSLDAHGASWAALSRTKL